MTNVFTLLSHYPRYESYRSQCLALQITAFHSSKTKEDQPDSIVKNTSTATFDKPRMHWSSSTTYRDDYQSWSQSEMQASRGQNSVIHDKVAESSVPELSVLRTTLKRYSLPNVILPIPTRCCCRHSKQWRDPCLKQTGTDYWKNLSCCGIIHENEFDQDK